MTRAALRPLALITRPRADAEALAEAVRALGAEPLIAPMLTIENLPGPAPDAEGVQAVLLTSANGARALAARLAPGDAMFQLPVHCVGDATARAAADCGFARPHTADGDVEALAQAVARTLNPGAGRLLHIAGRHVAGDLAGRLEGRGFEVSVAALYEARAAEALDAPTTAALAGGEVDMALFFSPRTTRTFVTLVEAANLSGSVGAAAALCLSEAVAAEAQRLPWARCRVAEAPTQSALLDATAREIELRCEEAG